MIYWKAKSRINCRSFFDALILSNGAEGLLNLSKVEPEQIPLILAELSKYDWAYPLPIGSCNTLDLDYLYSRHNATLRRLSQEEKAQTAALVFYLSSMEKQQSSKIAGFETSTTVGNTMSKLEKIIFPNGCEGQKVGELIERVRKGLLELPSPKQLEEK